MATIQQVRTIAAARPVVLFLDGNEIEWESKWSIAGQHYGVVQFAGITKSEAYDIIIQDLKQLAPCDGRCGNADTTCGELTLTDEPYFVGRLDVTAKAKSAKIEKPQQQTWQCPKCQACTVQAVALEVAHRCPSNRSQMTQFVVVND